MNYNQMDMSRAGAHVRGGSMKFEGYLPAEIENAIRSLTERRDADASLIKICPACLGQQDLDAGLRGLLACHRQKNVRLTMLRIGNTLAVMVGNVREPYFFMGEMGSRVEAYLTRIKEAVMIRELRLRHRPAWSEIGGFNEPEEVETV